MKTIVSVNQLSIYRAALTWYLGTRSEGDNVLPNNDLNILQDSVTELLQGTKPQIGSLQSPEIDSILHTRTLQWNSRVEGKFLAKQDSGILWK